MVIRGNHFYNDERNFGISRKGIIICVLDLYPPIVHCNISLIIGFHGEQLQHNNKLLQRIVQNAVRYSHSTPKNYQQFFYMQENNISSNCFTQLLYSLMMGH